MWKRYELNFDIQQKILHISEKDALYKIVHSYYHRKYQIIYQKAPIQETELDINEKNLILCIIEMFSFTEKSATLIREVRKKSGVPIIFISGTRIDIEKSQEAILAIENGADEYLNSSILNEELIVRIQAIIRLLGRISKSPEVWTYHKLQIIPAGRHVFVEDIEIELTKLEFDILYFLAQQNGRVVTYKELYEAVWNREYLQDDANIMAHVHRIRQKIEKDIKKPEYIQNVYGIGYRFGKFAQ